MDEQQQDWTNDQWVADQIKSQLLVGWDAIVEDNPEHLNNITSGFVAGRLRIILTRDGMTIEELKGYVAVPRPEDVPGSE